MQDSISLEVKGNTKNVTVAVQFSTKMAEEWNTKDVEYCMGEQIHSVDNERLGFHSKKILAVLRSLKSILYKFLSIELKTFEK